MHIKTLVYERNEQNPYEAMLVNKMNTSVVDIISCVHFLRCFYLLYNSIPISCNKQIGFVYCVKSNQTWHEQPLCPSV